MTERVTLASEAYDMLRSDIISSTLTPGGKLRMAALKERYNMGATPLREALSQLSAEGFVTATGRRGFQVPPLSVEDLSDIMSARAVLEVQCLKLSIEHGDATWESGLVASHYQLEKTELALTQSSDIPFSDWEGRHQLFHQALVAACPSQWLLSFREILYDQHLRYRHFSMNRQVITKGLALEHKKILQMALDRDVTASVAAMEQHITKTIETNIRALQQGQRSTDNNLSKEK